ncbi:MAG: glycosyltransferase [Gammaproteobacteria bacterium]|jgi:glycosyltransferase involved in cell wall biosynthesis
MATPLVSVVIPAYNHERFIGAAIESVLNQSVEDLELVIVDDGSTDGTAEVINSYDDPRLSYTYQENQDAFNTINRGLGLARGDYISILNSDDIYTLDRLERLLAHGFEYQSDCIISDVIPISDDGIEFKDPEFGWNQWHQRNRRFYFEQADLYTGFLQGNLMVTTSNLFMTRRAMETVGQFSSLRYLHDYDYIFRMMLAYPDSVHYLDQDKLLYYRIHEGNTLSEAAVAGREQDLEVIRKYMLAKLPEEYRGIVAAGSDRLRALENELHQVKLDLKQQGNRSTARVAQGSLVARSKRVIKAAIREFRGK